jgi:hypothetical protein
MTSSSNSPSPLVRLMWTAIFGVPGGILSWLAFTAVGPPKLSLAISGLIPLVLAAYAFGAFLLALVELGSPKLRAAVNQPMPPIQHAKAPGGARDFCPYCGAKYSRWPVILPIRGPQRIACGKCGKEAIVAWSTGLLVFGCHGCDHSAGQRAAAGHVIS